MEPRFNCIWTAPLFVSVFSAFFRQTGGMIQSENGQQESKLVRTRTEPQMSATNAEVQPTKPTVCRYLLTKTYECQVPQRCNDTDSAFSCLQSVRGTWSDKDDIVHYYQECVFTDHFTTCTFNVDGSYECRMVWEQRFNPGGRYSGDAVTGFRKVSGQSSTTRRRPVRPMRARREGGGTC